MRDTVLFGDALSKLRELPDGCVQTCVTSPPYFGLRDYGVEGQIGLEDTPQAYVANLVEVFQEVRRVLRDDGTLWLNLGDSYANDGKWGGSTGGKHTQGLHGEPVGRGRRHTGLKPKDLIGIPWRVAFALQDDGWYLRSDIIWAKGNCMPESVKDRPTKSHEYVFLLTKNQDYFYDQDAIREPHTAESEARILRTHHTSGHKWENGPGDQTISNDLSQALHPNGRNKRTVWHINPKPYKGAHFAVFPRELPELCVKAGTSEHGSCSECGVPWVRVQVRTGERQMKGGVSNGIAPENRAGGSREAAPKGSGGGNNLAVVPRVFEGWESSCNCTEATVVPCVVLDPFSGSGTTLEVAKDLDRDFIGIELNEEYRGLIEGRVGPAIDRATGRRNFRFMETLG